MQPIKNRVFVVFLLLFSVAILAPSKAIAEPDEGWMLTTFVGASSSLNNPFRIHLQNQDDVNRVARYDNQPFSDSQYWGGRMEKWDGNNATGFEIIHHKIYLANTDDIVENFSISDGFNLVYYNRAKYLGNNNIFRYGVGVVVGHPDVTIGGREKWIRKGGRGLTLAGLSGQLSVEKWAYTWKRYRLVMESKLTVSYARVPISDDPKEFSENPDIAFHFTIGFGSRPLPKNATVKDYAFYLAPLAYPRATGLAFNLK
jgi:hypothetical protein